MNTLSLLLIEDNPDDAELILREFRNASYEPIYRRVERQSDLIEALASMQWDVIISDYSLPNFSGPEAFKLIKNQGVDVPFILISGTINEEAAVGALKAGAHDFIMKNNLARLVPAVEREIREAEERRRLHAAENALRESEQRHRQMFAANQAIQLLINPVSGRIIDANPAAAAFYGYSLTKLQTLKLEALTAPPVNDLTGTLEHFIDGASSYATFTHQLQSGVQRDVEIYASPMELHGQPLLFMIVHDITERRQAEIAIRRHAIRAEALTQVAAQLNGRLDLSAVAKAVCSIISTFFDTPIAGLALYDEELSIFEIIHVIGLPPEISAHVPQSVPRVVQTDTPLLVIDDLQQVNFWPDLNTLFKTINIRTMVSVDIRRDGRLIGALGFVSLDSPRLLAEDEMALLRGLADQAAIAIDNTILVKDLQRARNESEQSYDETLEGWVRGIDLRDKETEGHTQRVTELTVRLARSMGFSGAALEHVRRGALLHDIGKMGIPDAILHKPERLSDDEWAIMRRHPTYAYEWLRPIGFLAPALDIPYCHHERWNGTGYPQGLGGEQIPLVARLFAIVDVWDAMRSECSYHAACSAEDTRAYIINEAGTHFDPQVVEAFLHLLDTKG